MNTKKLSVKTSSFIVIIVTVILLGLAIFPLHLISRPYTTKSQEEIESTIVVKDWKKYTITQLIGAEGDRLRQVDLSISNAVPGSILQFELLDAQLNVILTRESMINSQDIDCGWVSFPIEYNVKRGESYYIRYKVPEVDKWLEKERFEHAVNTVVEINLEDHNLTTATANSYMMLESSNPEVHVEYEWPDYNLIQRYHYSIYLSWWQGILLILAALVLLLGIALIVIKKCKDTTINAYNLMRYIVYPIIILAAAVLMINIFPLKRFGESIPDILMWEVSIILSVIMVIVIIENRLSGILLIISLQYVREHMAKWIRILSIAMMLWYGFTYVNGLYNIHHEYAYRRILLWLFIFLMATFTRDELINRVNAVWAIVGAIAGIIRYREHLDDIERNDLHSLEAFIIVLGGIVIINIAVSIASCLVKKDKNYHKPDLILLIPYILLAAGMMICGNGREWPTFLAFVSSVLFLRLLFYKGIRYIRMEVCNGVIVNFSIMIAYSLLHRPYQGYMHHRYPMGFHTVTVTAIYLTMVIAAIMVRLFMRSDDSKDRKEILPDICMLGIAGTYMLLTLSRTGYLSAIIMIIVTLVLISLVYDSKESRINNNARRIVVCGLALIVMFPITFTYTRLIPAVLDDPIVYDYEHIEGCTIYRGESKDSWLYMNLGRFIKVFNSKVLGVGDTITDASDMGADDRGGMLAYGGYYYSYPLLLSNINPEDIGDSLEQFSNGRLIIFKSYMEQLNMSGHDSMGAILPNGEIATHAHNTYLQAIYDHGYIVGLYFIVFLVFAWIYSVILLHRHKDKKQYLLLPVMLCGLMSTGLVEWVFHPCNPITMATLLLLIPTMIKEA